MKKGSHVNDKADIFSCGCLFYWLLTDGKHPFDPVDDRDLNMQSSKYDLSSVAQNPSQKHLIESMISNSPAQRPSSSAVLAHPVFWDDMKKQHFLVECAKKLEEEKEQYKPIWKAPTVKKLNSINLQLIINDDKYDTWAEKISEEDPEVWDDLISGGANYNGKFLDQLLRAMRNKCSHPIGNMTDEAKAKYPNHAFLSSYFTQKFPSLILHLYLAFEDLKNDIQFKNYYDQDFTWKIIGKRIRKRKSKLGNLQGELNKSKRLI